jgi:hypothetical protein
MKTKTIKFGSIELGYGQDVWGVSLFDKYTYTNEFGFEKL